MGNTGGDGQQYACCMCGAPIDSASARLSAGGEILCAGCADSLGIATTGIQPEADSSPQPPPAPAKPPPVIDKKLPKGLRSRITCPHCWHVFPPEKILWVAQHSDLRGDPVLGEAQVRFLPTRFTVEGHALDARGMVCQVLACPQCHLTIPRSAVENEPLFISIIGVPSSGKSYFLTALTWELRRLLPSHFGVSFIDADAVSNQLLNNNEERLFLQNDQEQLVAIDKTDTEGQHLYDEVMLGQQRMQLPKPFLFTVRPTKEHPNAAKTDQTGRVLCVYDNAGEHFRPGADSASAPITRHLAKSRALMFLYDPTKDPRFREKCRGLTNDPQIANSMPIERQETILTEAANRVRMYAGLPPTKKHDRPLIVIVPKADIWSHLLGVDLSAEPFLPNAVAGKLCAVDLGAVESVSAKLRRLLLQVTPEFVSAAEDFCEHVLYVPVSVFSGTPQQVDGRREFFIRAKDVRPRWITVPVLYMFGKWSTGLIGGVQRAAAAPATKPAPNGSRPSTAANAT